MISSSTAVVIVVSLPVTTLSSTLLVCLICSLVAYFANNMDPNQTAPHGSSLIRIYIVCFNEKIMSEVHLNIYSRCKKQTFSKDV